MNAILWKKIKAMKNQKIKLVISILLPILLQFIYYVKGIDINLIVGFMPYISVSIGAILLFNIEDLLYSEVILGTPLTLKRIWTINATIIVTISVVYCELILVGLLILTSSFSIITFKAIIMNLISILLSLGLILMSTIHWKNYSKGNQYLASVFALINFVSPFAFLFYANYLININLIGYFIISILLIILGTLYFKAGNAEELIINAEEFITSYDNQNTVISE
ncbi:hypothetical protein [Clostridium chrysemydis]|uniref:hypothetical protein n=1 Tax=Clostridium chrysemydis TaxID=2665504 RepID=UPI00188448E6|nr:hypothetical protein [Clostridium chrysemydis]